MAAVKKKAAKKTAVKKKAVSKKTVKKKAAKKKLVANFQIEPKLGHDPLAWISGNDDNVVSRANIVVDPAVVLESNVEENKVAKPVVAVVEEPVVEIEQTEPEELIVEKPAEVSNVKDKTMLTLPDVFGIAQAAVMYDEMNEQLSSMDEIQIDGSAVETVDASALQLLIALINECKSQGKKISWLKESDKINHSAKLLNLTESLGI
ncbi:MAG: STAS domain-containing protein [Gammaproteobacteria bacterium]|nr:STAS domain-containing protein [Gammaproteobacteria bacterium]MCW9004836.1 STAS domain-containing protein [Gammaproteobacteria bacterium]MCW9056745.1 STAS domain-containing protein [Gammaproteobacteria bacterium]